MVPSLHWATAPARMPLPPEEEPERKWIWAGSVVLFVLRAGFGGVGDGDTTQNTGYPTGYHHHRHGHFGAHAAREVTGSRKRGAMSRPRAVTAACC